MKRDNKWSPFTYKGLDWFVTESAGMYIIGDTNEITENKDSITRIYIELVELALETNPDVLYYSVKEIVS